MHRLRKMRLWNFVQTNTGDILIGTWGGISVYDSALHQKNISIKGAYENNLSVLFVEG